MATYAEQEEMIVAGVYQKGNSPEVDEAIDKHSAIEEFLCQEEYEACNIEQTLQKLSQVSGVEIPEEECADKPASYRRTSAELAEEQKTKAE